MIVTAVVMALYSLRKGKNNHKGDGSEREETFITYMRRHSDVWSNIVSNTDKLIICCPVSASLGASPMTKHQILSHIIQEDTATTDATAAANTDGCFMTLSGQKLQIAGSSLVCGAGFPDARRVKILTVTQLLVQQRQRDGSMTSNYANVYIINQPLVGESISAPEETDEIGQQLVKKYVATLRSFPELEAAFLALDRSIEDVRTLAVMTPLCEGFDSIKPSLSEALRTQWKRTVDRIVRTGSVTSGIGAGNKELATQQISQIVESYLMLSVSEYVYPWFCRANKSIQDEFDMSIDHYAKYSQTELGINAAFQSPQLQAVQQLMKLSTAHSPVDKMLVLKAVVTLIREEVDATVERAYQEATAATTTVAAVGKSAGGKSSGARSVDVEFATDDLVMIIVWVIVRCRGQYDRLALDLKYCEQFHFHSSSQSMLGFNLCHFQVAVGWLLDNSTTTTTSTRARSPSSSSIGSRGSGSESVSRSSSSSARGSFTTAATVTTVASVSAMLEADTKILNTLNDS